MREVDDDAALSAALSRGRAPRVEGVVRIYKLVVP